VWQLRARRRYLFALAALPFGAALPKVAEAAPKTFEAVGVTWAPDPALGPVEVKVRARQAAGWTPWQSAGASDPGVGARDGADLVWFGPSHDVEVVVTPEPPDLTIDLIDPGTSNFPQESAALPKITRRAGWGADEKKMTWPPEYGPAVQAVTWHHTATSNNYAAADVPGILRSIYQYQAVSRGWGDIGYHVLVDRFGRLWEGRAGGLDRPVIGAHAGGFNRATAGIVVIGNHVSTPVPAAAVESAARYIAWKLALTGPLDPRGTTTLTGGGSTSKYPVGSKVTVPRVFPHGLTNKTACPGQRGSDVLGAIRDRAYALTNSPDPALTVSS
jgi:uncharacterized protein with LGFP repeats